MEARPPASAGEAARAEDYASTLVRPASSASSATLGPSTDARDTEYPAGLMGKASADLEEKEASGSCPLEKAVPVEAASEAADEDKPRSDEPRVDVVYGMSFQ